jgi:hypothetical protein
VQRSNQTNEHRARPPAIWWVSTGAALVLVVVGLTLFPASGRDDIYITYWAAHTLSEYGQILNYEGLRVEQSSSLLHVLLLSALHLSTHVDVPWLGRAASIGAGAAAVVATGVLGRRICDTVGLLAPWLAATAPFFAYWTFSGLETSLFALSLLLLALTWSRVLADDADSYHGLWAAFAATGAVVLCRPESPFVVGCVLVGLTALEASSRVIGGAKRHLGYRKLSILAAMTVAWSAAIFGFRQLYFERWFPQPVLAKSSGFSMSSMTEGWSYVLENWSTHGTIWTTVGILLVAALFFELGRLFTEDDGRPARACTAMIVAVYLCFIIASGGDWMEGGRFFAPIAPLVSILLIAAIDALFDSRRVVVVLACAFVLAQTVSGLEIVTSESTSYPVWERSTVTKRALISGSDFEFDWFEVRNRVHERDMPTIVALDRVVMELKEADGPRLTLLSGQMGMVAYYTAKRHFGDLRFIDRRGLTSRHFTECRVTRELPRSPLGIGVDDYSHYLERAAEIEAACGLEPPDIITDLSFRPLASTWPSYELVYRQTGDLSRPYGFLQGGRVLAGQYIAVHRDRVESLNQSTPLRFEF